MKHNATDTKHKVKMPNRNQPAHKHNVCLAYFAKPKPTRIGKNMKIHRQMFGIWNK